MVLPPPPPPKPTFHQAPMVGLEFTPMAQFPVLSQGIVSLFVVWIVVADGV